MSNSELNLSLKNALSAYLEKARALPDNKDIIDKLKNTHLSYSLLIERPAVSNFTEVKAKLQYELISVIPGLRRYTQLESIGKNPILSNRKTVGEYLCSLFSGLRIEKAYMLALDKNYKLIESIDLSFGSVRQTVIYPYTICSEALRTNAKFVVVAHNHPGGSSEPSPEDIETTNNIKEALSYLDISLIDHMIIANGQCYPINTN